MASIILHKTDTYPERFSAGAYNRSDLDTVIKTYDVRGVVGEGIDAGLVGATDTVSGHIMHSEGTTRAVVGHDMRESSPELAASFADGAAAQGLNVTLLGLTSTDELYFASGVKGHPGAILIASHNPAEYNGIKMCRSPAHPIGQETGLARIKSLLVNEVPEYASIPGETDHEDVLQDYATFLHRLADIRSGRRLRVAIDAGNGMEGLTVPAMLGEDVGVAGLYFEFDGSFPNHEANPLEPASLINLQKFTVEQSADVDIAFDGGADRRFVIGERGNPASPSAICALIATRCLE